MANESAEAPKSGGGGYALGRDEASARAMAVRSAENSLAFLAAQLRPGDRLLDCGCGPGSLTLDLARRLNPGQVIGIDITDDHLAVGRAAAEQAGLENVEFRVGDAMALPFDDASFDVVLLHTVLDHVRDPAAALAEACRVLCPGGLVAARCADFGGLVCWPDDGATPEFFRLLGALMRKHGGDGERGRRVGAMLVEAGFEDVEISASFAAGGRPSSILMLEGDLGRQLIEQGLIDDPGRRRLIENLRRSDAAPGAFSKTPMIEALGRRG
jgi:SAM-dependent methyltransferase